MGGWVGGMTQDTQMIFCSKLKTTFIIITVCVCLYDVYVWVDTYVPQHACGYQTTVEKELSPSIVGA